MLGTLVRCSVAAVASIALLVAFVSTPEGFTKAKKPRRTKESEKFRRSKERLRSESPPNRAANRPELFTAGMSRQIKRIQAPPA